MLGDAEKLEEIRAVALEEYGRFEEAMESHRGGLEKLDMSELAHLMGASAVCLKILKITGDAEEL